MQRIEVGKVEEDRDKAEGNHDTDGNGDSIAARAAGLRLDGQNDHGFLHEACIHESKAQTQR